MAGMMPPSDSEEEKSDEEKEGDEEEEEAEDEEEKDDGLVDVWPPQQSKSLIIGYDLKGGKGGIRTHTTRANQTNTCRVSYHPTDGRCGAGGHGRAARG
jgi:hypothetical protein